MARSLPGLYTSYRNNTHVTSLRDNKANANRCSLCKAKHNINSHLQGHGLMHMPATQAYKPSTEAIAECLAT